MSAGLSAQTLRDLHEWTALDNQVQELTKQVAALRARRDEYEAKVIKQAVEVDPKARPLAKIAGPNGGLVRLVHTRHFEDPTFRYLTEALGKVIKSKEEVHQLVCSIKGNRKVKEVVELKRT